MKLIPLLGKKDKERRFAEVDDADFEFLNQWKWYAGKGGFTYYAQRAVYPGRIGKYNYGKIKQIRMHRQIMDAKDGQVIDHKDRNGLNNQKSNLRICTNSENQKNKKASGSSKYLGVNWHVIQTNYFSKKKHTIIMRKPMGSWRAGININGKQCHLKRTKSEIDAALSYNTAAKKYHGEFARLNIVPIARLYQKPMLISVI